MLRLFVAFPVDTGWNRLRQLMPMGAAKLGERKARRRAISDELLESVSGSRISLDRTVVRLVWLTAG
jgi:hypothetical protein